MIGEFRDVFIKGMLGENTLAVSSVKIQRKGHGFPLPTPCLVSHFKADAALKASYIKRRTFFGETLISENKSYLPFQQISRQFLVEKLCAQVSAWP